MPMGLTNKLHGAFKIGSYLVSYTGFLRYWQLSAGIESQTAPISISGAFFFLLPAGLRL